MDAWGLLLFSFVPFSVCFLQKPWTPLWKKGISLAYPNSDYGSVPPYYQNLWGASKQEKIAECIVPQSVHCPTECTLSEKYWGRQEFIPSGQQTFFFKLELDLKSDIVSYHRDSVDTLISIKMMFDFFWQKSGQLDYMVFSINRAKLLARKFRQIYLKHIEHNI